MKKIWGFIKFLGIAFVALLVLSQIAKGRNIPVTVGPQPISQVGKTPVSTATPLPWLEDDFATIRAKAESFTDAQWDVYAKTLPNHLATWEGWVEEAKSSGSVYVDMDAPGTGYVSVGECYISVPKSDVLQYSLDQRIRWTGTVTRVSRLFNSPSVHFDDCTVMP